MRNSLVYWEIEILIYNLEYRHVIELLIGIVVLKITKTVWRGDKKFDGLMKLTLLNYLYDAGVGSIKCTERDYIVKTLSKLLKLVVCNLFNLKSNEE